MSSDAITRDIVINASPETVYDVVSRPEHLAQWFSDEADVDPVPDARGVLIWRDKTTDQASVCDLVVVQADRPHVFAFRWIAPDAKRGAATDALTATNSVLVEFRITAEPDGTRLVVRESGMNALGWDEAAELAYTSDHSQGWVSLLAGLRSYAEQLLSQETV